MKAKAKCEECNVTYNKSKLRKHKLNKKLMCKICLRKIPENKFYTPFIKRYSRISNYSMRDDEKVVIAQKKGWKRVNTTAKALGTIRKGSKIRKEKMQEEIKQYKEKQETKQRKLVEGLK